MPHHWIRIKSRYISAFDRAVDGEVAQLIVAVIDVHFAQGILLRAGRKRPPWAGD